MFCKFFPFENCGLSHKNEVDLNKSVGNFVNMSAGLELVLIQFNFQYLTIHKFHLIGFAQKFYVSYQMLLSTINKQSNRTSKSDPNGNLEFKSFFNIVH